MVFEQVESQTKRKRVSTKNSMFFANIVTHWTALQFLLSTALNTGELKTNLRYLRVKLAEPDEKPMGQDGLDMIYNERDDREFILKTDVPVYHTIQLHRQRMKIKRDSGFSDGEEEDGIADD